MYGISLDFDDMLYNLTKINLKYVEDEFKVKINPEEIPSFSYYIDNNYNKIIQDVWNNPNAYFNSELYEGALEFYIKARDLVGIKNIQIVTSSFPDIIEMKNDFIKELGIDCKVIHSKEKYLHTKKTILVDDCLANIFSHYKNNNDPSIIFDLGFGWNKSFQEDNLNIYRGNSYDETFNILKKLVKG